MPLHGCIWNGWGTVNGVGWIHWCGFVAKVFKLNQHETVSAYDRVTSSSVLLDLELVLDDVSH